MKNKKAWMGTAALLALVLILTGCSDGWGFGPRSGSGPGSQEPDGTNLLSGTFGSKAFSVKAVGAPSGAVQNVEGLLKDGGDIYGLKGFYNTASGNFSFSGGSSDVIFELIGNSESSARAARFVANVGEGRAITTRKGANDVWTVTEENISFSEQDITGTPTVQAAPSLPEAWWGTYDYGTLADEDNGQGVESWMTNNGGEERGHFVMILGPYSMDFWSNLDLLRAYYEENNFGNDEEWIDEQMAMYAKVQSSSSVLQVSGSGSTYEVLLLLSLKEDSPYYETFNADQERDHLITETTRNGVTVREGYRKVQLVSSGSKLTATIAGDEDGFPYVFKTAAQANAATYDTNERSSQLVFERWDLE
jgi:hypothetical protein